MPLKLATTLPAAGSYFVEAIEAEGASSAKSAGQAGAFHGYFFVTVRSGSGKARSESLLLGPTDRTEP